MCDEHTASKMSAFSTAKRNGLSGENIIRMAQLQQYWCYGFTNPKYSHTATLTLPKTKPSAQPIQLPAPTLNDLLNPAPTAAASNCSQGGKGEQHGEVRHGRTVGAQ
jgi:hypothetical protein